MCELCVKEEFPDRGSFCLESGAYLLNLKECKGCGEKNSLKVVNCTNVIEDDTNAKRVITSLLNMNTNFGWKITFSFMK
ncbi:Protein Churchill [Armadillidium nasatum]|uniref:Protein Churchill n=1 Tax=Armadillidium nasatum TaxID=96803 RepID=A0A5N5SUL6_9CRUS|nr:Protein Churchill [Armadillidium nasatum]